MCASRELADACERVVGARPLQDGYAMVQKDPSRYLLPITELPEPVHEALRILRKEWRVGDEEIDEAVAFYRAARQLAQGFYYRWVWGHAGPDKQWLAARAAWRSEVRGILTHQSRPGLDSPALVARAAEVGEIRADHWEDWAAVRDRPEPPVEAVWLDSFLVEEAARWGDEAGQGIIWFESRAFGEALEGIVPVFAGGDVASREILCVGPETHPVIACSWKAHGTGVNLQAYSKNLFVVPPSNGQTWEQALGRTHRPGQQADRVEVDVFMHTKELRQAWDSAVESAKYVEQTTGQKQKILQAEVVL